MGQIFISKDHTGHGCQINCTCGYSDKAFVPSNAQDRAYKHNKQHGNSYRVINNTK